jgi:hypothetical protein
MPIIAITNSAYVALRRSAIRDLGPIAWQNGFARRIPGTMFWEVSLTEASILNIQHFSRAEETLSDTIVRMIIIYERHRRQNDRKDSTDPTVSRIDYH